MILLYDSTLWFYSMIIPYDSTLWFYPTILLYDSTLYLFIFLYSRPIIYCENLN